MKRTIRVKEGQTILDIAVQECGDITAVFDIADLNGKGITDTLTIGEELELPSIINPQVVKLYKEQNIFPSSAEDLSSDVLGEGLEYWAIEVDFIIS